MPELDGDRLTVRRLPEADDALATLAEASDDVIRPSSSTNG
ncbi:hypothetical protein [Nonomuraea sp. NPDC003201]